MAVARPNQVLANATAALCIVFAGCAALESEPPQADVVDATATDATYDTWLWFDPVLAAKTDKHKSKWPGIFTKSLDACWPPTITFEYDEDHYKFDEDGNRIWHWYGGIGAGGTSSFIVVEHGIPGRMAAIEVTGPKDLYLEIEAVGCASGIVVANAGSLHFDCPVSEANRLLVNDCIKCIGTDCDGKFRVRHTFVSECGAPQHLDVVLHVPH